jgi:hypothetical protein
MKLGWLTPALLGLAAVGTAQIPGEPPVRIRVEDLLQRPGFYHDRMVLVVGELRSSDMQDDSNRIYELRDPDHFRGVRVGTGWGSMTDLRFLQGQKVEVVGVFWDLGMFDARFPDPRLRNYPGALRTDANYREEFRYFLAARDVTPLEEEREEKEDAPAPKPPPAPDPNLPQSAGVDLRDLAKTPETYAGTRVSVIGKFRGNNLYGDLSMKTKRGPRDFVMKVAEHAIWVTGRRPRGNGFDLNPDLRRDTGKWLRVSGLVRAEEGVVYLKADFIELAPDPDDPDLEPKEAKSGADEAPKIPPEVTFSLPLDGERGIPLETEFRVQFSKDMNQASFDRNVDLLYADDDGRSNPFPEIQIRYEPGTRTLVVIPGKTLQPGKEIRLVLYQSIRDFEGLPLSVAKDAEEIAPQAAVVLTFFTARP